MNTLYLYTRLVVTGKTVLVVLLALAIIGAAIYIWVSKKPPMPKRNRLIVVIALVVVAFFMLTVGSQITCDRQIITECTIDESYSAVELYDKYNVISKRGDIWVLEKKRGVPTKNKEEEKDE